MPWRYGKNIPLIRLRICGLSNYLITLLGDYYVRSERIVTVMEYIQAFLFTSKYLLGRNGNTDIFYLFAAFVLLFYIWKRPGHLKLICKLVLPVCFLCVFMALAYPWINVFRCFIFFAKIVLNCSLLVFVAYNCRKWKMIRFAETIVWIHAIETALALLLPGSSLWTRDISLEGIGRVTRLRLFYQDAGSMAFACGFVLVLLVYQLITEEIVWRQLLGIGIMVADLYLAYGMGGISCTLLAVSAMLFMAYLYDKRHGTKEKRTFHYVQSAIATMVVAGISLGFNSVYSGRILGIINGTDSIFQTKIGQPIRGIGKVLTETKFLGVGFGNANTGFALDLMGVNKAYPNSFLRMIAEGGIFGILLVLVIVFGLGYFCLKYGNVIDRSLYIYVIAYQLTGGYFTDPTNFFIYGWIIGDCIFHKIEKTGTCRIKLFVPKQKESLRIAMIGHKRIPSREGGVEIVVEELATRMVAMGHQVDAYNRSGQHVSGSQYNVADYDHLKEYKNVKIIRIPTIQRKGFAAFVYAFLASILVVTKDYDVVHYHAEGSCLFLVIPSLFGIKTVATIHGLDWKRSAKWGSLGATVIRMGERMAVRFADEIIVLSKSVQRYFDQVYGRETILIPNGVNRPATKAAELIDEKWKLQKDSYYLTLSRLTREKRIELLISAYQNMDTERKLVIAGGSSDSDEYVKALKELAKDDERIIFTGFVQGQEMEELFSNAYVYVLPSELEGMPLSLMEAMSYGNCCLVSDIPENVDVVKNNGVSFETNDVEDLQRALQRLEDAPELVEQLRSESADYICKKYDWNQVVEKTFAAYW